MDTRYARITEAAVQSTQDVARAAFREHEKPVLIVAGSQTRGRGRAGATWLEASRGLYSSLAVAPAWATTTWPRLSLATGLAVADAIEAALDINIAVKWPNDLLLGEQKIGGVLIEAESDYVVIGCGVNLWWPDAPAGFGGLCDEDPGPDLAGKLAGAWADNVLDVLDGPADGWDVERYRAHSAIIGRTITWEPNGVGIAIDIDVEGYLHVEENGLVRRVGAGEVNLVRRATVPPDSGIEEGSE